MKILISNYFSLQQQEYLKNNGFDDCTHIVTEQNSKDINHYFVPVRFTDGKCHVHQKTNSIFNFKNILKMINLTEVARSIFEYEPNKFVYLTKSRYRLISVNGTKIFIDGNNARSIYDNTNIALLGDNVYELNIHGADDSYIFCPSIGYIEDAQLLPFDENIILDFYKKYNFI